MLRLGFLDGNDESEVSNDLPLAASFGQPRLGARRR